MRHKILVIDDSELDLQALKSFLEASGFQVRATVDSEEGLAYVRQNRGALSLAIVDYHMPGNNGAKAAEILSQIDPSLQIVTYSGETASSALNETLAAGSQYFIQKGTEPDKLLGIVNMFCKRFEDRNQTIIEPVTNAEIERAESIGLFGCSRHIVVETTDLIHKFAPLDFPVLITGENGIGKERVARAIHNLSGRRGGFIAVNCGAIPADLLESELFGHEKGAFSGAFRSKIGIITAAKDGTIFLDEIGDLPLQLQVKLLRFLQEREVRPVGSNTTIKVNTRVILATNVNLEAAVPAGRFREDLYYRINAFRIDIKPLRQRKEDIRTLIHKFATFEAAKSGIKKEFLEETVKLLSCYDWPGNVRALENEVKRAMLLAPGDKVTPDDIHPNICETIEAANHREAAATALDYGSFRDQQRMRNDEEERKFLLEKANGVRSIREFARDILKISNSTLQGRLKSLGIEFKPTKKEVEYETT